LSIGLGLLGLCILLRELDLGASIFGISADRRALSEVIARLQEVEEALSAGLVPEAERWKALEELQAPWGALIGECVTELRSSGGSLVPTLRRLRMLAQDHQATLARARGKVSQSLGQAGACLLLVPAFGASLYCLLPGLDEHPIQWSLACGGSFTIASLGALWMLAMASAARWGGLRGENRRAILVAYCGGERFLALLRAGVPADLAWARVASLVEKEAKGLGALWGHSIWERAAGAKFGAPLSATRKLTPAFEVLASAGEGIKKAVQVSLMDGRPCAERVETALLSLRGDWESLVERELGLLATRTLKPLFLCVAPALIGLLLFGVAQVWLEAVGATGMSGLGI
jgi:hypothetical protein